MGDNFTGFNAAQAFKDINEFQLAMGEVAGRFANGGARLFDVLRASWFSTKAVEFGKRYSESLYTSTVTTIANEGDRLANSAASAFNSMAAPNGGPYINSVGQTYSARVGSFGGLMATTAGGSVGMNQSAVRDALNEYISAAQSALSMLSSVPSKIALYDKDNNLQGAFRAAIESMKSSIRETVSNMIRVLNEDMESEATLITNAAENAANALVSGGTASITGNNN